MFDRAARGLGCVLLGSLLCCVLAGVVTRALGDPLSWTDEGARFLMVWLACTGWVLASRSRGHVRVRFFQDLLPGRAWFGAERLIQLSTVVLGAVVAVYAVLLVGRNMDLEATSLPLSMAWLYAPLAPAGLVSAVGAWGELVRPRRAVGAVRVE